MWGHRPRGAVLAARATLTAGAGSAFQSREKYLLPFLSLQIMDFLLCLLTLLGAYIELPAYLKLASRARAVSAWPCSEAGGPSWWRPWASPSALLVAPVPSGRRELR